MATSFPLTSGRAQMRHLAVACRQIRQAAGFGEITSLLQQLLGAAALISILTISLNAASGSVASRKLEAREQFDKAEQMREALNGRPADQRTRKDYQHVADAYRK